jgi:hypothetical protein
MKLLPPLVSGVFVVAACMLNSVQAANFTTTAVQASGTDWNAAIWNPGPVSPTAGNTYEVLLGGRVRSPAGTAGSPQTFTFPGDALQLDGNGFSSTTGTAGQSAELRLKSNDVGNIYNFPGVGGNAGLVLNGGIVNNGDERIMTISGRISATAGTTSSFNPGGQATTDISAARGFLLTAELVGSGSLSLDYGHDFGATGVTAPALQINSSNSSFTGDWIVNSGWLKGTGANSLGLGNFTVASTQGPSTLDFDYDISNPSKSLTLIGTTSKLILDQNLTFGSVTINSTPLAQGFYTFQQLNSQFDANFVDGGTGTIAVVPEPMSAGLLLIGSLSLIGFRRRR